MRLDRERERKVHFIMVSRGKRVHVGTRFRVFERTDVMFLFLENSQKM